MEDGGGEQPLTYSGPGPEYACGGAVAAPAGVGNVLPYSGGAGAPPGPHYVWKMASAGRRIAAMCLEAPEGAVDPF